MDANGLQKNIEHGELIRLRRQSGFFLDAELEKALYRLEERGLVESVNDDEYEITFRRKSA